MKDSKHFETLAVRTQDRSEFREHSAPIFMTSSFVFEDAEQARALFADEIEGNIYSRFSNPNTTEFIRKVCKMEGAEDGIATASGMSAIFTSIMPFLNAGDHIVVSRAVFGSTHQIITQILPRWGIEHTYVDASDRAGWEKAFRKNTKMVFIETPSNPGLELIDIAHLSSLCKANNVLLNVDNCFATPYLQRPMEMGADIVMHSATKFIDGQGRTIGGVIVASKPLIQKVRFFARHTGPAMSPFNAWILSKSLETLAVRMDRHCENAVKIAKFLESHPCVEQVLYPHLPSHPQFDLAKRQMSQGGGIVTFSIKAGIDGGRRFLDANEELSFSANLGDTRTIVTHPASTTHSKLTDAERAAVGIGPGTIRVSVGLEHPDDIMKELDRMMNAG